MIGWDYSELCLGPGPGPRPSHGTVLLRKIPSRAFFLRVRVEIFSCIAGVQICLSSLPRKKGI